MDSAAAGSYLQYLGFDWEKNGNLKTRTTASGPSLTGLISESMDYDALNRLEKVTRTAGAQSTVTMQMTYEPNGNIKTKSGAGNDVGTYVYGANVTGGGGPHAVVGIVGGETYHYDSVGNLDCRNSYGPYCYLYNGITWYTYNLPQRIYFPGQSGANYADFAYGPNRERVRQKVVTSTPAVNKTIYYIEDFFEVEAENNVPLRYRSNVSFGGRVVYSQLDIPDAPAGQGLQQFYVHQTVQGTIDRVSFAGGYEPGSVKRYSFDAYGKRREMDWSNDADDSAFGDDQWIERGYTGHEHLDNVQLIHMNGRVQNPLWGRMLSPDPVLGDLANPQELNAYSYGANNPASLTDPSGFAPQSPLCGGASICDIFVFSETTETKWYGSVDYKDANGNVVYHHEGATSSTYSSQTYFSSIAFDLGYQPSLTIGLDPLSFSTDGLGSGGHAAQQLQQQGKEKPIRSKEYICRRLAGGGFDTKKAWKAANSDRHTTTNGRTNWNNPTYREGENWLTAASDYFTLPFARTPQIYVHQYMKLLPISGTTPFSQEALDAGLDGLDHMDDTSATLADWCDGK